MGVKLNPFTGKLDVVDSPSGDFSTVELNQGTQTNPSIVFDGDPNTGIYSPGADQVAISTNGAGRLFINASGNVGIGDSTPDSILDIASDTPILYLEDTATYGSAGSQIIFRGPDSGGTARNMANILGVGSGSNSGKLVFQTRDSGSLADRVTITSDGKLGVGTSSPQAKFEVAGDAVIGTDNAALVEFTSSGVPYFAVAADASNYRSTRINVVSSGGYADLSFDAMGTAAKTGLPSAAGLAGNIMYLDASSQRVGIGTTSPGDTLDVAGNAVFGTAGQANRISFKRSTDGASAGYVGYLSTNIDDFGIKNGSGNGDVVLEGNSGNIRFKTGANTESARIDNSGRLLVGTSSSFDTNSVFEAVSTSNVIGQFCRTNGVEAAVTIQSTPGTLASPTPNNANASIGALYFRGYDSTSWRLGAKISAEADGQTWAAGDCPGRLVFSTTADGASSPTARMTIKNNGNVGIGTESPSNILVIAGQGDTVQIIDARTNAANGSIAGIQLWSKSAAGVNNYGFISYDGDDKMQIGTAGMGDGSIDIAFAGANGEAMRIDSSGRLLVGTSSTSEAARAIIQGNSFSSSGGSILKLSRGNATPNDGGDLGNLHFTDSNHGFAANISALRDGGTWTSGSSQPTRLVFSTTADGSSTPTERMKINSNGHVVIQENKALYVSSQTTGGEGGIIAKNLSNNTSAKVIRFRGWDNSETGAISTLVNTTTYATSSDYRLKENVVPLTDAADRLKQLKPSKFNFIANPGMTVDGFLAHEAQAVVPECVVGTKDEVDADGNPVYQGIDQSKLVPLLTAALQEALAKIETLEQRLSDAGIA